MYRAKYTIKSGKLPSLNAKFRFYFRFYKRLDREKRKEVHERIGDKGRNLIGYFNSVENLPTMFDSEDHPSATQTLWLYVFEDDDRKVEISETIFQQSLAFNLEAKAKRDIPLEKIVDLNGLDQFILYGNI